MQLAERHPQITVEPNVLFVDKGSILASAGAAASLDLCLHIVRRDLGVSAANVIARGLVTAPYRSGGQAQYLPKISLAAQTHGDTLVATREWAMTRLDATGKRNGFSRHIDRDLAADCVRPPVLRKFVSLAHSSEQTSVAKDRLHETALDQRGERVQLSSVLSCEDEVITSVPAPRVGGPGR